MSIHIRSFAGIPNAGNESVPRTKKQLTNRSGNLITRSRTEPTYYSYAGRATEGSFVFAKQTATCRRPVACIAQFRQRVLLRELRSGTGGRRAQSLSTWNTRKLWRWANPET